MKTVDVLVAVDCQVDFCNGALGTDEAQASVPAIVKKINAWGSEDAVIIATQDTHGDDYMETNEGRHLPVPHTIRSTKGWQIVPEIYQALERNGAKYLLKDRFGSPDLPGFVRMLVFSQVRNLKTTAGILENGEGLRICLIGWCTDICVISNALLLKAAFPEAKIIVDSACCAGVTPEAHEAALTVLRSCQVEIVGVADKPCDNEE